MARRRTARRTSPIARTGPLALRHPVEWTRLPHLLSRTDRIALLEQLGERRTRAGGDRVLQLFRQIGEGDVGVDCLDVAQQLVGQATRSTLQCGEAVEHR